MHRVLEFSRDQEDWDAVSKVNTSGRVHYNNAPSGIIARAILNSGASIVALDGSPGSGKSVLARNVAVQLSRMGVRVEIASTDLDVLARDARGDKEIIEFHPGEMVKEAVRTQLANIDGRIDLMAYDGRTGQHTKQDHLDIPGMSNGVLIVEGVRAIEHVVSVPDALRKSFLGLLNGSLELIEKVRYQRDVSAKGLDPDVVRRRVETQRSCIKDYYGDLDRYLRRTQGGRKMRKDKVTF